MRRRTTALLAATTLAGAALLSACGGGSTSSSGSTSPAPSASTSSTPTTSAPTPSGTPSQPADPKKILADAYAQFVEKTPPANTPAVTGEPGKAPTIAKPQGNPPTKMVVKDLIKGTGKEVPLGGTATFHYVGVAWDTGKVFDSSWQRGEPITFPLPNLIPGWQIGIPDMKEGGRRELVIPPELAYGPAGSGHELAGKTLVFVIDVIKVGG